MPRPDNNKQRFCPYCGQRGPEIRQATKLMWCKTCRITWIVAYARQMRAKPRKPNLPRKETT